MPAYKSLYLKEAIGSIVSQSCNDWELVVVDDCSPEDLFGIVSEFSDDRIRYVRNEKNIGGSDLVAQWNHSLTFAHGEWVVLAADDDFYAPDFCKDVLSMTTKYPNVNLIRMNMSLIDEHGKHIWGERALPEFQNRYDFLYSYLNGKTLTCIGNYVFRSEVLRSSGGFVDFPCAFCSDIATPIKMAVNGVANTQRIQFGFRQSRVHLSGDRSKLKEKLDAFSLFYRWLDALEYEEPSSHMDIEKYSVKNSEFLHKKYIYDCFNHVIKLVPLKDLPRYLALCRDADPLDKVAMSARWCKSKLFKK